ncbi:MAG: cobalamin B12-binding domain-containing protein [Lysobacterales bacterium]
MGEAPPLNDYSVTHGICAPCAAQVLEGCYHPTTTVLAAQRLFQNLFSLRTHSTIELAEVTLSDALKSHVSPSELMLGILQPALYSIGERWERGLVTPAEEHRITASCEEIYRSHVRPFMPSEPGKIVLAAPTDNKHDLGMRFLGLHLLEQGEASTVLDGCPSGEEIVAYCLEHRPAVMGLSVALAENLNTALALAQRIERETDHATQAVVGGFAAKSYAGSTQDIRMFPLVEDLLSFLQALP